MKHSPQTLEHFDFHGNRRYVYRKCMCGYREIILTKVIQEPTKYDLTCNLEGIEYGKILSKEL